MRAFRPWNLLLVLTAVALALWGAVWLNPLKEGLTAAYYASADASGVPVRTTVDVPATRSLVRAWDGRPPNSFSATWSGALVVLSSGPTTLATTSDDGSRLYLDGRLVVDNGGPHSLLTKSATVELVRGVHAVYVEYSQNGGQYGLELKSGTSESDLSPIPSWALISQRSRFHAVVASIVLWRAFFVVKLLWASVLFVAIGGAFWRRSASWRATLTSDPGWPVLRWLLAGALILIVTGIWWGLPGAWVAIELGPGDVVNAVAQRFANGWFDAYPPLHFVALAIALAPARLLETIGVADFSSLRADAILLLICRLLTVAASVGLLITVYFWTTRIYGRRAGWFAVVAVTLNAPFLYYAKTANSDIPYMFWWVIAILFYLRLLDGFRLRDYVWFAVCAMLAVCTKDQAYGLFALLPVVIVYERWRHNRARHTARPLFRAVVNREHVWATVAAVVTFVLSHNLLFNVEGFREHVAFIVGDGSVKFRLVEPTVSGHVQLLRLSVFLIQQAMGWPMFVVSVAGVILALARPEWRRPAVWLLVSPVSYYLTFIDVVLYNYDRFILPMCVVLAVFAGLAIDRVLQLRGPLRMVGRAAVAVAFGYTLLYAGTVDVLMLRDSRYGVQRWLAERAGGTGFVGHTFNREYLPNLDDYQHGEVGSIEDLHAFRPQLYVLNADYAGAIPTDSATAALVTGLRDGSLGYRLALRARTPAPWPWLPAAHSDLVGARLETTVTSTLRNINPTIEVFERIGP